MKLMTTLFLLTTVNNNALAISTKPTCIVSQNQVQGWFFQDENGSHFVADECLEKQKSIACHQGIYFGWYSTYTTNVATIFKCSESVRLIESDPEQYSCGTNDTVYKRSHNYQLIARTPCSENLTAHITKRNLYNCQVSRMSGLNISLAWNNGDQDYPDLVIREFDLRGLSEQSHIITKPMIQKNGNNLIFDFQNSNGQQARITILEQQDQLGLSMVGQFSNVQINGLNPRSIPTQPVICTKQ